MIRKYLSDLDGQISQNLQPVTKWLMYISCFFFLLRLLIRPFAPIDSVIMTWIATSVERTIMHLNLWQVVTYAAIHLDFLNLLFSMLAVYFFAQRIEQRWGSANFLRFALVIVVGTAVAHLLICAAFGRPLEIMAGLSSLVFGILFACAWYYPDDIVYFQMLFPIKIKYLVAIIGFMTFLSGAGPGAGLSNLTPLSAFLIAYLYVKFPAIFEAIPVRLPRRRRRADIRDIRRGRYDR